MKVMLYILNRSLSYNPKKKLKADNTRAMIINLFECNPNLYTQITT